MPRPVVLVLEGITAESTFEDALWILHVSCLAFSLVARSSGLTATLILRLG